MSEHNNSRFEPSVDPTVIVDPGIAYTVTHPDGMVGATDRVGNRVAYMDPRIFPGLLDIKIAGTEIPYDELKKYEDHDKKS